MAEAHRTAPKIPLHRIGQFWAKVDVTAGPYACWPWTCQISKNGYGLFKIARVVWGAHVLAYFLRTGVWPPPLCVLHACDNRACCNPRHLTLGTKSDNTLDMVKKGRNAKGATHGRHTKPESTPRGARHWWARLTEVQVREIRRLHDSGNSTPRIAALFGISSTHVRRVVRRQVWAHLL